jgi:hypothetical protein
VRAKSGHPSPSAVEEEELRLRRLRLLVDTTRAVLMQDPGLTLEGGLRLIGETRRAALALFPGKEREFELIYWPRFRRILEERLGVDLPDDREDQIFA